MEKKYTTDLKLPKARLIIDITKNVVKQYREQLKKSIEENKNNELVLKNEFEYQCVVTKAERALELINQILTNFDISVFDGSFKDNIIIKNVYTDKGMIQEEPIKVINSCREDVEVALAKEGAARIFKQIGINEYALYPLIYHIMLKYYFDINARKLDNDDIFLFMEPKYNKNGIYNVGNLKINSLLSSIGAPVSEYGYLIRTLNYSRPVYYDQRKPLTLSVENLEKMINDYISKNMPKQSINERNEFLIKFFKDIYSTGSLTGIGRPCEEYVVEYSNSYYYDDIFKNLDKPYSVFKFFKEPLNFNNNDIKNNISLLVDENFENDENIPLNDQIDYIRIRSIKKFK